jgi:hypothetical protein
MSWCRATSGAHDQIVANCVTVAVLSCLCALSDERSGLSFVSPTKQFSFIRRSYGDLSASQSALHPAAPLPLDRARLADNA